MVLVEFLVTVGIDRADQLVLSRSEGGLDLACLCMVIQQVEHDLRHKITSQG